MDQLGPIVQGAQRRSMKDFAEGFGSEVIHAAADSSSTQPGGTGVDNSDTSRHVNFTFVDGYVFAAGSKSATISYAPTSTGVVLTQLLWRTAPDSDSGLASQNQYFGNGTISTKEHSGYILSLSDKFVVLDIGTLSKDQPDKVNGANKMQLLIKWTSGSTSGSTPSEQFAVVASNLVNAESTTIAQANARYSTVTDQISTIPATATATNDTNGADLSSNTSTATSTAAAGNSGGGGGGLGTGAIVGIVIGVVGGLLVVAAIAFFLLRKRRNNKKAAAGYTGTDSANTYMVDKETQGRATDSPNSPYSDENIHHVPIENVARDDPATATTPVPRTSTSLSQGRRGSAGGAQTPQGVSSNVAHLVEDGMTAEEIQRLEEEERQLDDEIERAARR